METTRQREWHDLSRRTDGGLDVTLVWNELSNELSVLVADEGSGDFFEIAVTQADDALDIYRHPYAYAAARGIAYRSSELAVADLDVADPDAADPDAAEAGLSASFRDDSWDIGELIGPGNDEVRGSTADAGTGLGGNPLLISQEGFALVVAVSTIALEHVARSWLRWWLP
jgi:hypothetical protein